MNHPATRPEAPASNAAFDAALKAADPRRGIRDAETVIGLAALADFTLLEDTAMPSNNRCLIWQRTRGILA
ncbi:MAG: DUF938 domain-containing protein [Rhodocyclaceae bacterium]|jgi:hypothetical protein|nr:DUF938 domain-containing protein [Rhodocyclaceae bacterium]